MRWSESQKPALEVGSARTRWTFLFLPKKLGGEYRWLERAKIHQTYHRYTDGFCSTYAWTDERWANV